jgi:hypothetical protein
VAGLRDRALLLVGFVAALRRSELAALAVDEVADHPNGLVLASARSKSNQTAERADLAVLPRSGRSAASPLTSQTCGPYSRRVVACRPSVRACESWLRPTGTWKT